MTGLAAPWRGSLRRDLLLVLGTALALRLLFLGLTANTYDYDEFVLLTLGRDWAHGSVPYRDFMFFHPPGALAVLRVLEPLTSAWWPAARLLSMVVDVATAGMVWKIGTIVWQRRAAMAAGLLYAMSPLALVSAVRVGQDPLITAAGVAGLLALLAGRSRRWALVAGIALGVGMWIKYPAAYFLPVYLLAAPRLFPYVLAAAAATVAVLLAPFLADRQALYDQTILFQSTRYLMEESTRLGTVLVWWLGANALAVIGLPGGFFTGRRGPAWLVPGFVLGGIFLLGSQVYYHYFVSVVPFACLLAAPLVVAIFRRAEPAVTRLGLWRPRVRALHHRRGGAPAPSSAAAAPRAPSATHGGYSASGEGVSQRVPEQSSTRGRRPPPRRTSPDARKNISDGGSDNGSPGPGLIAALLVAGTAVTLVWAFILRTGGASPLYVTAAHLPDVRPAVELIERTTPPGSTILTDRYEYAYLSNRQALAHYFWDEGPLLDPHYLERRLRAAAAAVLSSGASSGFQSGVVVRLDRTMRRHDLGPVTVWTRR